MTVKHGQVEKPKTTTNKKKTRYRLIHFLSSKAMMKLIFLTLFLFSATLAIRWRGYNDDGEAVVRVLKVVRQPPLFPQTYELRGVERVGRGRKGV
jgi:hypothetical protein